MDNRIRILLDRSHKGWVLGGLFNELAETYPAQFKKPIAISRIKSRYVFISFFAVLVIRLQKVPILFSSITPLENFLKYANGNSNQLFLWFTHQNGDYSRRTISILQSTQIIFVHSAREKKSLHNIGIRSKIVPLIGAIKPEYFTTIVENGTKIVFIGTPSKRKNPFEFIRFVKENPQLQFKVLGKDWHKHEIWEILKGISNLEYVEIGKRLSKQDLNDCSHHLILSSYEGGPISLIESVAAGLIPVCTNVGIAEEFLKECGYTNQIISAELNFHEINLKIKNNYSRSQKEFASKIARKYTIERFASTMLHEIMNFKVNQTYETPNANV
jgi:glycosyltransferase involved in cell wall biosynthesis